MPCVGNEISAEALCISNDSRRRRINNLTHEKHKTSENVARMNASVSRWNRANKMVGFIYYVFLSTFVCDRPYK